ncbi:MAG TPA: (d)CMP kinase [Luteibaculaceae bacterium]|nr:(d)CMP kinase [Luteibaculaceae bacterium]
MPKRINIAIDGFSSCGKSTLAKDLAERLNYVYIDSGAMYRAVTLHALEQGWIKNGHLDEESLLRALPSLDVSFLYHPDTHLGETLLNGRNVEQVIRTMEVSRMVSTVSKLPAVRQKLVELQQNLGKLKGVVMDGRDIGTVVFPDAELKLFLTARTDIRAKRRLLEMKEKGQQGSYIDVLENLNHRDFEDTHRALDPLRQADDAILLDNSELSKEQQLALCIDWVQQRINAVIPD